MAITSEFLAATYALKDWIATIPGIVAVPIVDPTRKEHPRYPDNPRTQLPAVFVVPDMVEHTRKASNARDSEMTINVWIYLLQTPNADHTLAIMIAAKTIEDALLNNPRPIAQADMQTPEEVIIGEEMAHELGDDPELRVSVAQIRVKIMQMGRRC